jgi:hypothetical protein
MPAALNLPDAVRAEFVEESIEGGRVIARLAHTGLPGGVGCSAGSFVVGHVDGPAPV